MLSARLRLDDLTGQPWSWSEDRWVCGESSIKPLSHPCLTHGFDADDEGVMLTVEERPGAVDDRTVDATYIQISRGKVAITAGRFGTAPLYLAAAAGVLEITWDLAALAHHARVDRLHDIAVTRLLTRRHRYGVDTPFRTIKRLTERATAVFSKSGLHIEYPEPAERVARPRRLRPDVDPIQALDDLLRDAATRVSLPAGEVGVELSGGVDSANVAATVSAFGSPLYAYGLIFEASLGESQQVRREALIAKFGLIDLPVDASKYPPFRPNGPRGLLLSAHDPGGDFYREAFGAAANAAHQAGVRVLFTGFGGDEMVSLRGNERSAPSAEPTPVPWLGPRARAALPQVDSNLAPPSPVPMPALMASAARNPALIQHDIWPVSPLSDPRLIRFGDSLPLEWRRNKRILRDRLRGLGLSANVVEPDEPENFLPLMERGLRPMALPLVHDGL